MTGWKKQYDGKFWMDPMLEELVIHQTQKLSKKISGRESFYVAEYIKSGKGKGFWNFRHEAGIKLDSEYYYDIFMHKNFLDKIRRLFFDYKKREYKIRRQIFKNVKKKVKVNYNTSKKYFMQGYALSKFTDPGILTKIENELRAIFEKRLGKNKHLIQDVDTHDENNFLKREELDILELALLIKTKKDYKKKLDEIFFNHGLLRYVKRHKPLSKIYFLKKAKEKLNISEETLRKEIQKINEYEVTHKKLRESIFKKYGFSVDEKKLVMIHSEIAHIRMELRTIWIPYYCEIHEFSKVLAKSFGLKKHYLDSLSVKEFEKVVKTHKLPKKIIRPKEVLIYKERDKTVIFFDKQAREKAKQFDIPLTVKYSDNVSGEIANKGYIEGKVRVLNWDVNYLKNMKVMKQDEILVVTQTKPDMMEAIKKASGIITNEGGMISHAAIISRELGIPCLIKTDHATEVFKTGEIIVLDCKNKGVAYKK